MKSSIIICTRNRPQDLHLCLNSLAQQEEQAYEIIIVDSSDLPLSELHAFATLFQTNYLNTTPLRYVHTKPGLTYQRNIGLAQAHGDVIYFFDDDVIIEPTYLREMNMVFRQYPNYGGGMGSIINSGPKPTGFYHGLRKFFLLPRDHSSGKFTFSGMPTHAYGRQTFQNVQVLGGCCMAYRRSVIANLRFDEQLTGYGYMEDCDMSARISVHSPLFYNPKARLHHMQSPLARDKIVDNRAMFIKNYSYLFFKNFYPQNRLRIIAYWWSILGLFMEAILLRNRDYINGYVQGLKNSRSQY